MGLFGRLGRADAELPEEFVPQEDPGQDAVIDADAVGPWDVTEKPSLAQHLDLGGVRLPKRQGLAVRMELDKKTRRVIGVNLSIDGSALQIQAFAAPRSAGLWEDLREELTIQIGKQGGSVEERTGTFGPELLARMPIRLPDGRSGHRPARFLGVDGPRWFLRGVITGKAAVDPEASGLIEELFGDVVVVRGSDPRPPRDLLPLTIPGQVAGQPVTPAEPTFDVPERGPEVTELR